MQKKNDFVIGVDASNIHVSSGGSFTHIYEILHNLNIEKFHFDKIIIWSNKKVLDELPSYSWLEKRSHVWLNKSLLFRQLWQKFLFSREVKNHCSIAFIPGGVCFVKNFPVIVMSRNMLPFEWHQIRKVFPSLLFYKYILLRHRFIRSFRHAKGLIFLSDYAKTQIVPLLKRENIKYEIIPHGVDKRFDGSKNLVCDNNMADDCINFCYVSSLDKYKHHDTVLTACKFLVDEGYPITITFVGRGNKNNTKRFLKMLKCADSEGEWSKYLGFVPYVKMADLYKQYDGFVYASSCENFPNILIQAMRAHMPIVCSNVGVMPEIIRDAAYYFDPTNVQSLIAAMRGFLESSVNRNAIADVSYKLSLKYDWNVCVDKTFSFIESVMLDSTK